MVFIIYALALTVGPRFFYPGFPTDGMVMNCHKSLAVIFWVGVIVGIIGLALILIKNREVLLGGHIVGIIASAVVAIICLFSITINERKNEFGILFSLAEPEKNGAGLDQYNRETRRTDFDLR